MVQKKGILKIVAKTGGVKVDDSDWINPTNEAKIDILNRLDQLKKLEGKEVVLELSADGYYYQLYPAHSENGDVRKGKVGDDRLRSMCLAYAKDLACDKIISIGEIEATADRFLDYVLG